MHKIILSAYVDSKEQKMTKKTQAFFTNKGIPTKVTSLKDGDVSLMLTNKRFLIIERKTIADFAGSYIKGHLQDQAIRMNENCEYYAVIVYGNVESLKKISTLKRVNQAAIDKMTAKIEVLYKCPVFFVDNATQYLLKIMDLAKMVKEANTSTVAKPKVAIKNRPDVNILRCKNGIGEKMALTLLNEFKTPQNVLNATREELKQVKGVGDGTVASIQELKQIFEEGVK